MNAMVHAFLAGHTPEFREDVRMMDRRIARRATRFRRWRDRRRIEGALGFRPRWKLTRHRPLFFDRLGKSEFRSPDELLLDLAAVLQRDEMAGKIARSGAIYMGVFALLAGIDALLNYRYVVPAWVVMIWLAALLSWRQWHLLRNT